MPSMTTYEPPVVVTRGSTDPDSPLVVLLHGRGSDEQAIIGLADLLPEGAAYAAVRAPIAEGGGFAWFANRGIGRPIAESLDATITWFRGWLDESRPPGAGPCPRRLQRRRGRRGRTAARRPSALRRRRDPLRHDPVRRRPRHRPRRLAGTPVFVAHGDTDQVIPLHLQQRLRGATCTATRARRPPAIATAAATGSPRRARRAARLARRADRLMVLGLDGKVALVTGASKGLGAAWPSPGP